MIVEIQGRGRRVAVGSAVGSAGVVLGAVFGAHGTTCSKAGAACETAIERAGTAVRVVAVPLQRGRSDSRRQRADSKRESATAEGPGVPGAVLLRGAEPVMGVADDARRLAGPGLLCLAMGITTALTDVDLVRGKLTVRDATPVPARAVASGPRIGIATSATSAKPWRYWITGSPGVSRR